MGSAFLDPAVLSLYSWGLGSRLQGYTLRGIPSNQSFPAGLLEPIGALGSGALP